MIPKHQVAMMALACLVIRPLPVSAQTPQTKGLAIEFAGGNAFVFSDDKKQVDIGAVAPASSGEQKQFAVHSMHLVLKSGSVEKLASAAMLPEGRDASDGSPTWALKKVEVWFRPDKTTLGNSTLKTSKETADQTCDPKDEPDNSFYVPDLLALHKANLLKGWRDHLESRIVLRGGTLTVARARDCFTFSPEKAQKPIRKQSLAHSKAAVRYNVEFHEFVDMLLKAPDGTGKEFAVLRFRPSKGNCMVWLSVEPPETDGQPYTPTDLNPGDEVTHFQHFYELTDVKEKDRLKLFYTPRDGKARTRTPGSECPTARFGG